MDRMKPVPALLPFSWLYECIVVLRNLFFDLKLFRIETVGVPVISVGNITTGGTGKTPVVELVATTLERLNVRTAIVSRGYGRTSRGLKEVSDGFSMKATVRESGDEAFQLAGRLPKTAVVVDKRRIRGARHAVERLNANAIVLDDGFQHRALHRDLDIVLVDAAQSPFETAMLPAGFRREPLSALRRADVVILTKVRPGENVDRLGEQIRSYSAAEIMTSSYRVTSFRRAKTKFRVDLNSVRGKHAVAFCGIGRPESFEQSLEEIGVRIDSMIAFNDHHWYSTSDLQRIVAEQEKWKAEFIVSTEKDFVRVSRPEFFERFPFFYIEVEAEIHQKVKWNTLIASVMVRKNKR
jgi:tetraacyldisaccharide 4'-kinase